MTVFTNSESEIQQLILLEAPKLGVHLMRNNVGAFKDSTGRFVRYGLGNISKLHNDRIKSSDLIGFRPIRFNIGVIAQIVAVECKAPGFEIDLRNPRIRAQQAFIDFINNNGGKAGFCDSVESFRKLISS